MSQNVEGMQRSKFGTVFGVVLAALVALLCMGFCASGSSQLAYADEPMSSSAESTGAATNEQASANSKAGDDAAETASGTTAEVVTDNAAGSTESPAVAEKPEKKPTKAGWMKDTDGTWYYFTNVNAKPSKGWVKSGGKWYWMQPDKNGAMATNMWITDGNKRYYLTNSGAMKTGWIHIGNDWYYANASGAQVTSGWLKLGKNWYWFQADEQGLMAANQWITTGNKMYYLSGSGAMKTGWVSDGSDWYYTNKSGARVMNGWVNTGGKWYWMQGDKQGLMLANDFKTIKNKKYSFAKNGAMRANTKVDLGDNVVGYAANSGAISRIGENKNGKLVLTNSAGQPLSGWQKFAGKWFYGEAGTGVAKTGWLKLGKTWYYLDNNGAMATGTQTIKGKANLFTSSGKWIGVDQMATKAQGYSSGTGYLILVDRKLHRVGVFSGYKGHWNRLYTWSCVTGAPGTPTITGVFRTPGGKMMNLTTDSRARWCTQISGGYFFHTILASNGELGNSLSHGCIRLAVPNAQWIYSHIGAGTTVVIYN